MRTFLSCFSERLLDSLLIGWSDCVLIFLLISLLLDREFVTVAALPRVDLRIEDEDEFKELFSLEDKLSYAPILPIPIGGLCFP